MKASATKRSQRRLPITLFEQHANASSREVVRERIAQFARAVARRHLARRGERAERGDRAKMLVALRGYYLTWSVCAPFQLPALDEELVAVADAAYSETRGMYQKRVAA